MECVAIPFSRAKLGLLVQSAERNWILLTTWAWKHNTFPRPASDETTAPSNTLIIALGDPEAEHSVKLFTTPDLQKLVE